MIVKTQLYIKLRPSSKIFQVMQPEFLMPPNLHTGSVGEYRNRFFILARRRKKLPRENYIVWKIWVLNVRQRGSNSESNEQVDLNSEYNEQVDQVRLQGKVPALLMHG
ncbi:hypothetical protein CsSME_00048294 [Camellia sinensis var. sinensis]